MRRVAWSLASDRPSFRGEDLPCARRIRAREVNAASTGRVATPEAGLRIVPNRHFLLFGPQLSFWSLTEPVKGTLLE